MGIMYTFVQFFFFAHGELRASRGKQDHNSVNRTALNYKNSKQ